MTAFDFSGSYNGVAVTGSGTGSLTVTANQGGNSFTGVLAWNTTGTSVNGTLDGNSRTDPADPQAGYIELAGETSGVVGTASVIGHTENRQGTTPGVGLQFIVRVTWAQAISGSGHDLNSEVVTFTRT